MAGNEGQKAVERAKRLRPDLASALLIFLLAFAVYSPGLKNGFVCDDDYIIFKNPVVTGQEGFSAVFASKFWGFKDYRGIYYRPVVTLSYWVDFRLHGARPGGYHASNIIFHCLASVFLFLAVRMWSGGRGLALLTGLLFAAHPAHTQSVSWIAGRTDVLCALFCMLSFFLFMFSSAPRGDENGARAFRAVPLVLSLASFAFAVFSKEVAAVFPVLIFLADISRSRAGPCRPDRRSLLVYGAFILVVAGYLLARHLVLGVFFGYGLQTGQNWYAGGQADVSRLITVFKVLKYYIMILACPVGLSFESRIEPSFSWLAPEAVTSVVVVCLFLAAGTASLHGLRKGRQTAGGSLGLGIFWLFITLLPVANIFPMQELAMEHFLYLPSAGFCLGLAWIFYVTAKNISKRAGAGGITLVYVLLALVLIIFSSLAVWRNAAWRTNEGLWRDAVRKTPLKLRPRYNLGEEFYNSGEREAALHAFMWAVKVAPDHAESHYNLGVILAELGRPDEAAREYRETIRLDPRHARAHVNLGGIFLRNGEVESAAREYMAALKADPGFMPAYLSLAQAYMVLGRCDEARDIHERLGSGAPPSFTKSLNARCPEN